MVLVVDSFLRNAKDAKALEIRRQWSKVNRLGLV